MTKIAWCCDNCNRLVISDSKEHHKMDFCSCNQCGCDLEEYGCRWSAKDFNKLRIIARLEDGKDKHWKIVPKGNIKLKDIYGQNQNEKIN